MAEARVRALIRPDYVTPIPEVDADFEALKTDWEADLRRRADDLPCGKCLAYDEDKIILSANAACKAQDVALLCISAEFHLKGSPNQQTIGFWALDHVRAFDNRKRIKSIDNCKVTNSLKSTMKSAFWGRSIDNSGKGATYYACSKRIRVLERRPQPLLRHRDPRKIPTPDGWVYVDEQRETLKNPVQKDHWVFTLRYDRAECPTNM